MRTIGTIGIDGITGKVTIPAMAADKKQPDNAKKQGTGYRLRPAFQPLAEQLAKQRGYNVTDLVNEAVRRELEREGLWPPRADAAAQNRTEE